MRKLLLYILCLAYWAVFAQNPFVDSLKQTLLIAKDDTNKVNTLNEIAKQNYFLQNPDSVFKYSNNARILAEKISYKKGKALAHHCMALFYLAAGDFSEAIKNNQISIQLKKDLGDKAGMCASYQNLAQVYQAQGNYTEMDNCCAAAEKIWEELGVKRKIADISDYLGQAYYLRSNFPKVLECYFKSYKIWKSLDDKKGLSIATNNIGLTYHILGENKKALDYLLQSLKLKEELGDKKEIGDCYNNIGLIYSTKEEAKSALEYHFKALKIRNEINDRKGMTYTYNNLGQIYLFLGDDSKALEELLKSLEFGKEIDDPYIRAASLGNISLIYRKQKNYKEAENYSKQCLDLALDKNMLSIIKDAHEDLSIVYEQTGRHAEALEHYKAFIVARDSISNEENTKKTVRLEMNFEFEKKEAAAKLEQEKKEAVAAAESKRQTIIIWAVCSVLILVIAFAVYAFRSYLQKRKANEEILSQKETIEEKQKEILDSIHYAKRIQTALLPSEKYISKILNRFNN
ncbi:MAG: tetratricopeptide repeat protein [Bacteroidota bacterium]|nr:tetratricopeptide repeat protein [Bacteroidota bacterium]